MNLRPERVPHPGYRREHRRERTTRVVTATPRDVFARPKHRRPNDVVAATLISQNIEQNLSHIFQTIVRAQSRAQLNASIFPSRVISRHERQQSAR
jgi:hypothetical protein